MAQTCSSKNTSINIKKLPAVYNKIDWSRYSHYSVIDIGCGRIETQKLILLHLVKKGVKGFFPWDMYHPSIIDKDKILAAMNNQELDKVIVCSNVLNVIDDDKALNDLIAQICDLSVIRLPNGVYTMHPVYVTIYEGNKSGIGRQTKKDCYQRNERLCSYLDKFNTYIHQKYNHNANFFKMKYGMIVGITQSCK